MANPTASLYLDKDGICLTLATGIHVHISVQATHNLSFMLTQKAISSQRKSNKSPQSANVNTFQNILIFSFFLLTIYFAIPLLMFLPQSSFLCRQTMPSSKEPTGIQHPLRRNNFCGTITLVTLSYRSVKHLHLTPLEISSKLVVQVISKLVIQVIAFSKLVYWSLFFHCPGSLVEYF